MAGTNRKGNTMRKLRAILAALALFMGVMLGFGQSGQHAWQLTIGTSASAQFSGGGGGPPPGGGGGSSGGSGGGTKASSGNGSGAGPAAVACVGSAALSTIGGGFRQSLDKVDPRDMTGKEAAWSMAGGCPVFFPLAALYPPDNGGTRQIARLTSLWRESPQGKSLTQTCHRGAADACASGMDVFWGEEEYAYQNGYVRDNLARHIQLSGILVTSEMVKQSKHPLNEKIIKIARRKHR
jgi:hypothetical protein